MARDSSLSVSNPCPEEGLPIITCTNCGLRKVVRRKSKQAWSLGRVFYCCPLYKRDGSGCPFWYWEEDYEVKLRSIGVFTSGGLIQGEKGADSRCIDDNVGVSRMNAVNDGKSKRKDDINNEVVRLLKSIFLVCMCILCVQMIMLFVQLCK